jgi:hypothetical protein
LFCIKKKDEKDPVKADLEIKKKKSERQGTVLALSLLLCNPKIHVGEF